MDENLDPPVAANNESSMEEEEESQESYPVQDNHQDFIPVNEFTPEYVNLLQKVQDRIANPRQDDNLESIVKLVQQTNCFAVDNDSIQFDLCLLDKRTVNKITKELGISAFNKNHSKASTEPDLSESSSETSDLDNVDKNPYPPACRPLG